MPAEGADPNAPGGPQNRPTPDPDAVDLGGAAGGGTLKQSSPPSWIERGSGGSSTPGPASSSNVSRSGKELSALNRELERSQALGVEDVAEGYLLVRKLGTGSFGAVWEAESRHTGERVAIKFFTAGDVDWAKLLDEVGLLQKVEGCRGIIMVKHVHPGEPGHRPYYVMQLANGGSLADWVKAASGLSPRERVRMAIRFFARSARAMATVHRRGIHHCDLKPQNILLHSADPGTPPEPLIADFGQAHLGTDDTPALGTFFYMPPEQIDAAENRAPPDTRWDVYALGAVMYEMLTGEPPRRSPELVARIKKAPRNLAARMAIYREGLIAEPRPTAHHKLADPMLAKIIDRCITLRAERRPPDAGALAALLDARAKWRRTRPVLGLAACATLLVILLIASLGLWAADTVTERTKTNVTAEVTGSLARTAGYGTRAVEDRLQRHVVSLDQWAGDVHTTKEAGEQGVVPGLRRAAVVPRGPSINGTPLDHAEHAAVREWLARLHKQRKQRTAEGDHLPTLGVMLVADADTGEPQSRGFYVARVQPDGAVEDASHFPDARDREFFTADLSYRDYFGALPGGEASDVGRPHPVVRAPHISHPFRSRGVDQSGRGPPRELRERWKLNIVSPIWDNPDPQKRSRVIGLLVLGLDVEYDLKPLLYPPEEIGRPAGAAGGFGIDRLVKVVVADHRGRWMWHPDFGAVLASDRAELQVPPAYPDLARKHRLEGERAGPWLSLTAPGAGSDRYGYSESAQYVDALELELHGEHGEEIACFTRFDPYRLSRYHDLDASGKPGPPRRWVFAAQVDRRAALRPLDDMKGAIVRAGVAVVGALALIAAGLWTGLVLVLRRLEFVSHG